MEMMFTSSILLEINMILGLGCYVLHFREFIVPDGFFTEQCTNND